MKVSFEQDPKPNPADVGGMKVHYAPARRQFPIWRWYLLLLLLASPVIYYVATIVRDNLVVEARGLVTPQIYVTIRASEDGIVGPVRVAPGAQMQPRDQLLTVVPDSPIAAPPADKSKFELDIALYQQESERARAKVDYQRERLEKMRYLREQGAATSAEVDQAWSAWMSAVDAQAEAENGIRVATARRDAPVPVPPVTASTPVPVPIAERRVLPQVIRDGNAYLSPRGGQVVDTYVRDGDHVLRGMPLMSLLLNDVADYVAYLDPKYLEEAKPGHVATVTYPDGLRIHAVVTDLEQYAQNAPAETGDPFGSRKILLPVRLKAVDSIPADHAVGGLPIVVRFK